MLKGRNDFENKEVLIMVMYDGFERFKNAWCH